MAAALLEEFGSPDARVRDEAWRYSKPALRALSQQDFAIADGNATVADALRDRFAWLQTQGNRVVFVNGVFSTEYSSVEHSSAAQSGRGAATGLEVHHEAGHRTRLSISADIEAPLHVVYLFVPAEAPSRWSGAVDIEILRGNAHIIEHLLGERGVDVLGALTSQITLHAGAKLRHTILCELPDSASLYRRTRTRVDGGAVLRTTHALFGGRLQRHDIDVELAGERAHFESRGVFALTGRQHVDTHLDVRHAARDTACDIVWRGVADQRSRGIFYGAITVAEGADGADAQLSNKNLLLSTLAEIDTQPALEIYADEVKAAHGATVGQLDERALFYLRSRGISSDEARRMLVGAFSATALDRLDESWLRERISALLAPRLGGESA